MDYYLNSDRQEVYDRIEEEILDHFDFAKVQKVMEFMDWTWYDTDGVPSISDIRKKAREMLRLCADKLLDNPEDAFPDYATGTGGLYAKAYRDAENGIAYFRLYFAVEAWDNFD